jgi:hypothetical protein
MAVLDRRFFFYFSFVVLHLVCCYFRAEAGWRVFWARFWPYRNTTRIDP